MLLLLVYSCNLSLFRFLSHEKWIMFYFQKLNSGAAEKHINETKQNIHRILNYIIHWVLLRQSEFLYIHLCEIDKESGQKKADKQKSRNYHLFKENSQQSKKRMICESHE